MEDYLLPEAVEQHTPIGSKLVFSRYLDRDGEARWSVELVYQTTKQLRGMLPLSLENPPMRFPLRFEGVATDADGLIAESDLLALLDSKISAYDALPEQFDEVAGLSSDVYAFGRLFHYMLTGINPLSEGAADKFLPLQDFDEGLSYSLELLIEDCTILDKAQRIPDMYGVTKRMVEIASCTPRSYKKMEKEAYRAINDRKNAGVVFEKNIRL